MKTKRHAARLRHYEVTAKRGGAEIGRCIVQALSEDEALIEGSDELSSALGLEPIDDSISYGAKPIDSARI